MVNMNLGVSLSLVAVGAILAWAVSGEVAGIDIKIVGVILMVVGLAGSAISLLFWSNPAPRARQAPAVEPRQPDDRV